MQQAGKADVGMDVPVIGPDDFSWIVINHQKQVYRVLLGLVKDADIAEVLTQECFLRAYRKHSSYRGESSLVTWLLRIAVNLAFDYKKNRRWTFWRRLIYQEQIDFEPIRDSRPSPEQSVINTETINAVQTVVDRLPERQKTVFLLRFIEEMPLNEIAVVIGREVGTVKTHLNRAVKTVRSACGRYRK
jgi:RNA polymerase sigma-70 factor (ECF subfamily)